MSEPVMPDDQSLRWSVERRQDFIRDRLVWEGRINRVDLVARFGISPNQATADLRRFEDANPGAIVYDARAKTYRAGAAVPGDAQTADLLRELRLMAEGVLPVTDIVLSQPPVVDVADGPLRRVAPLILQRVIAAIRERRALEVGYRSMTSPEKRPRVLEPHALIFDGFRWHMRAHDRDDGAFKDFVLGRLSDPGMGDAALSSPAEDGDWHQRVALTLAPHPMLDPVQGEAIELDYGMEGGRLTVTCRRALVWYVKRRLGLLPGHETLAAQHQHIVLVSETGAST